MADFINRVTAHFDELTKSHKEVANYFLYNLDKVAVGTLEVWPDWSESAPRR